MNRKAFTLLELLMVVIIIGILATIAVPQYQNFREKAIAAEAIQLLGSYMRQLQTLYIENQDGDFLQGKLRTDILQGTENWDFSYMYGLAQGEWFLMANRKDGPYVNYSIFLKWFPADGRLEWAGTHPATPGGPTDTMP